MRYMFREAIARGIFRSITCHKLTGYSIRFIAVELDGSTCSYFGLYICRQADV